MPTKRNKRSRPARALTRNLPHGLARTRELEAKGASRTVIRRMVDAGELRQVARGLYAPADLEATEHHGLAAAAALVALEALREYRRARRSIDDLTRAAEVVRVTNVMRPYLESVLA